MTNTKRLIILRGLPCSGKSSWIKDKGYEIYALSMDAIRLMMRAPSPQISQEHNNTVHKLFMAMLENRMIHGDFTVVDNVHQTLNYIKPYFELAKQYGYFVEVMDFSTVPLQDCIERNKLREKYKFVPEDVIVRMNQQMIDSDPHVKTYLNDFNEHGKV